MYKKFIFVIAISLIIISNSYAQESKIYYDSLWRVTDKTNAGFFRECSVEPAGFVGQVKDYYITGEIQMTGNYNILKEGEFLFYYKNGQIEKEGFFKNNLRTGVWTYYYLNGKIKQKIEFNNCELTLLEYNDSVGNSITGVDNVIIWKNDYIDILTNEYSRFGHFYIEGKFENGLRNGEWICKDNEENVLYKEKYSNGKFKKRVSYSENFKFKHPNSFLQTPFLDNEEICNKIPLDNKFYRTENFIYSPNVIIDGFADELFFNCEIMPIELFTQETLDTVINKIKQIFSETNSNVSKIEIVFLTQKDGSVTNVAIKDYSDKVISSKIRKVFIENLFWTPGYQRRQPVNILKSWIIDL